MIPEAGEKNRIKPPASIGIYIHFPFCQQKCNYCDFYSEAQRSDLIPIWVEKLLTEIDLLFGNFEKPVSVSTIYIGGGSPNLLPGKGLVKVVEKLKSLLDLNNLLEFTIELNPNYLLDELLEKMREVGINRVSLGCQSFREEELKILGRLHSSSDVYRAVSKLRAYGFENLSLDLIYGIPGEKLQDWQESVSCALSLQPSHLSLYNLSYEKGTPIYELVTLGKIVPVNEDEEWKMFSWADEFLTSQGFEHYEISNWALPHFRAIHNQSYWNYLPYIGLGPSAHSFFNRIRSWNVRSIDDYISLLEERKLPIAGEEFIDANKERLERIMLGLRTSEGLSVGELPYILGMDAQEFQACLLKKLGDQFDELIKIDNHHLRLTLEGWFVYNSLLELILDLIEEK